MFAARDPNGVPAAPSIKIPTLGLSSDSHATMRVSTYAPTASLRRRSAAARLPGSVPASSALPTAPATAELCVHECGVEGATAAAALHPWDEWTESPHDDARRLHEAERLLEATGERDSAEAHVTVSGGTAALAELPEARDSGAFPAGELLLHKDEFLERLVQRVRASCATLTRERSASGPESAPEAQSARTGSPPSTTPPRHPASPPEVLDSDTAQEPLSGAGRRSRAVSQSPSPLSTSDSPVLPHRAAAHRPGLELVQPQANGRVERGGRVATPPATRSSGATSPSPRRPSTDLYAAGGALRGSLQHSRCSGVSRDRRSPSVERPTHSDVCASPSVVEEMAEAAGAGNYCLRAATATETHGAAECDDRSGSERPSVAVAGAGTHPRWDPHPVSDSRPSWNQPHPQRRQRPVVSAPGSKAPPSLLSVRRGASMSPNEPSGPPGQRGSSAERVLRRTSSSRASRQASLTATTSPTSPPSARALFHRQDTDSGAKAALPPAEVRNDALLQSRCDAALARAARAEHQCSVLSHALQQLRVDQAAERAAWRVQQAALEQQVASIMAWIGSVDAEAGLTAAASTAPAPAAASAKDALWDAEGDIAHTAHSSGTRSADGSPLRCAPGATPTPARHHNRSATDSGDASTGPVRLPPSPPLLLRMHAATTK
ncbi:hypothetical protein NESM_000727300 [Novymonas esmeraldas]|uniref:Uncharacterized protein n=1 Tax=Novymonas esmeraldas TaxID=1808958 RepID=A0AAW0EXB8_9TRYP